MQQALLTAVVVLAVLAAKETIMWFWHRTSLWGSSRAQDDVFAAVVGACRELGLNWEAMRPTTDLKATGRLVDVLTLAAERLGKDHELRTVQDVCDWLAEAPTARR